MGGGTPRKKKCYEKNHVTLTPKRTQLHSAYEVVLPNYWARTSLDGKPNGGKKKKKGQPRELGTKPQKKNGAQKRRIPTKINKRREEGKDVRKKVAVRKKSEGVQRLLSSLAKMSQKWENRTINRKSNPT